MRLFLAFLLFTAVFLSACSEQEPIKIGFIGSLSGRAAAVSQASRDGALFAVEEVNRSGGINGRQLELIAFDDQHQNDKVREGVNTLADSGAVAIIGPITSQMSVVAAPVADQREIVLVSPTTSTVELSDKKDYFFRTISSCDINARNLATYALQDLQVKRLAILQDLSNMAFTNPWREHFKKQATKLGGEVVAEMTYFSLRGDVTFSELANRIIQSNPDAILVLTNSIDAALFSQQVAKLDENIKLMGSDWSYSGDLFRYGGKSVEGFYFTTNLNMKDNSPAYTDFKAAYSKRFGVTPKFPSVLGYEATRVVVEGLRKAPDFKKLKAAVEELESIEGVQGTITINSFGDTLRPTHINKVQDGDFAFIKKLPSK